MKPLFHSSQARNKCFQILMKWMKVLAVNLRVGFCDEWKRGLNIELNSRCSMGLNHKSYKVVHTCKVFQAPSMHPIACARYSAVVGGHVRMNGGIHWSQVGGS